MTKCILKRDQTGYWIATFRTGDSTRTRVVGVKKDSAITVLEFVTQQWNLEKVGIQNKDGSIYWAFPYSA
jgi:hypothetical protein